ncbi:endo alpha-1,4 polygalactosaminidase [Cellulomonas sp. URHB0016]
MITLVRRLAVAVLAGTALVVGVGTPTVAAPAAQLPPADGQLDYQIGGAYTPASTVAIVDRDRLEAPAAGRYNVCYVNAFQTQPGDAAWWKTNHDDLLLKKANGTYVVDSAWDEMLLDTSTAAKRTRLLAIVGGWIDGCKARGYDAVEPDNLDSYSRSSKRLTTQNNVAFARLLAARAHADGLAIAQKNDADLTSRGTAIGFDFAIVEECQVYDECDDFTSVYGARVYEIEYTDNGGTANFAEACDARGATTSVIYRDRDVVAKGRRGYVYTSC